jgi:cation diffusion facilitator family transporter
MKSRQKRVLAVVFLTFATMCLEIAAGRITGSMALEADGYHMASHAGALAIAFVAYLLAESEAFRRHMNFGTGKILALGGYSNALGLACVAFWMLYESSQRLLSPKSINFTEALYVSFFGLVINLLSAWLLGWGHHDDDRGHDHPHSGQNHHDHHHHHDHPHHHQHGHHGHQGHHDHNHHGALMHVLADALTSVLAIVALFVGRQFASAAWLDPVMGVVGALVILRWSWGLLKQTARELLDFHPQGVSLQELKSQIEKDGHRVHDLHVWSQGQGAFVGTLSVSPVRENVSHADFRSYFSSFGEGLHLVVEKVSAPT